MLTNSTISENITRAIAEMGFTVPTLIQEQAIPFILEGKDIIGQAQTGTGKTAAFAIPVLELIDPSDRRIQALILCPTRELAIQTSKEFMKIGKFFPELEILPVYGGQHIEIQLRGLKRYPQIVIGTPGRLIDHINRKTLDLSDVSIVTLDEADEMLDMGFRDDINRILDMVPPNHQTLLFSATMPKPIMELSKKYLKEPVHIKIMDKTVSTDNTEQIYFEVREKNKIEALTRLIDYHKTELAIIFCRTKSRVDELAKVLNELGYMAQGLHGDLRQVQRDNIMSMFRQKKLKLLVATDVAARGIDVDNIEIVFNYDLPQDPPSYTHRIGRTGRAGKTGKAFTFVSGKDVIKLKDIARITKSEINLGVLPSKKETENLQIKEYIGKVLSELYNQDDFDKYYNYIDELESNGISLRDFIATIIKMQVKPDNNIEKVLGREIMSSDERVSSNRKFSSFNQNRNKPGYKPDDRNSEFDNRNFKKRSPNDPRASSRKKRKLPGKNFNA